MNKNRILLSKIAAPVLMLVLIVFSRSAAKGALEGIELCLYTVIPALFPFFVVSAWINPILLNIRLPFPEWLSVLLGIPHGCEGLLLMGILGGYPVGAQTITEYYQQGYLSKECAQRLLGFCNNAGPAFIFGMAGMLFPRMWIAWILWGIHILSAMITGVLIPHAPITQTSIPSADTLKTFPQALKQAIHVTASVCGWTVLFRSLQSIVSPLIERYSVLTVMTGFLELSGGCYLLFQNGQLSTRFILFSIYLGFGGICVMMQTASVTQSLGLGLYPVGKTMQTAVSFILACTAAFFLFPQEQYFQQQFLIISLCAAFILMLCYRYIKNKYGNFRRNSV